MNASKFKVVQLSSVHLALDTRIFRKISKTLVDAGYDVDLIIQHDQNEIRDGINIIGLPIAVRKIDRIIKIIPKLFYKCIKYPKNTIFHFHDIELIPIGLLLKKLGYKVIYDVHEDAPRDILTKEWLPIKLRVLCSRLVEKLEQIGLQRFDAVVVVTRHIQERLDSNSTFLIQNFPRVPIKDKPQEIESAEHVLYVGDITDIRGIKQMIDAVYLLNKSSGSNLRLKLAGKFSPPSLISELETKKGWEYVDFLGWIDRNEFVEQAKRSIAGLVIFHPVENHIKAQPNKLFEYMLQNIPVVGSNFDLWKEIVEKNECGILVDPLNPNDISDALTLLLNNPEKRLDMGRNGRKAVIEKYNWKTEAEKLLFLYKSIS